jgi:hypothetical protein
LDACEDYDLYLRIARSFPIYCHDEVVVEYRKLETNNVYRSGLVLRSIIIVLKSQRNYIKGHKQYKEAYKRGIRTAQGNFSELLRSKARVQMQERKWQLALRSLAESIRYSPQGRVSVLRGDVRESSRTPCQRSASKKPKVE